MILDLRFRHSTPAKKILYIFFQILLISYAVAVIFPVINMFISSFKTTREIFLNPFSLPKQWRYQNYIKVWRSGGFGMYFVNSILITAVSMFFVILFGSMAANGVSRYTYKMRLVVYLLFLSGIVLPLKAAIIPLFLLMGKLNLTNTRIGLMLIFTAMGLPSTVFILSGFMKGIPKELEYAARIDGCNDLSIYKNVVMPLSMPSITLVTIYNIVPIWNDFFFPLVFISSESKRTLPLGVASFFGQFQIEWDSIFAALSISIIPMIIIYMFMSKYFIKGMTAGAVKG
ncbi:carbohydrate ABC transporter permease [Breznakiella homolactica]|uniref:sn-glycerol-3-phosphate transport system permease protein UgpE n=1 Tax=Breznakiella homolactica TaxID=2798577 RepID=A0A7T7XKH8_9SPIR|nr:carbohydrate ABC transporter permease [Breznakiella homolactica]QQO07932.1 carbohydrate ABC transporter permease [Breznakiella homolactica]